MLFRNVSPTQRILRVGAGLLTLGCGLWALHGLWLGLALATAITLVATGLVGYCPACAVLRKR